MADSRFAPVKYDLIRLQGGLDLVTPTLAIRPGVVRNSINFEASVTGGYTRIPGYERHDGRPNPSDAVVSIVTATLTASVAIGSTITGATSAASGVVIKIDGPLLVLTKTVGFLLAGESIKVAGVTVGALNAIGGAALAGSKTTAQYQALAADNYRADIGPVPGSGPVRGVAYFAGTVYAWRNNAAGTALAMYRASSAGWVLVTTPALAPGGRIEAVVANFGGAGGTKLYGCDGRNKAFVFDGTTYTQIATGMTVDKPAHIAAHKLHLFLSFGASVQFSAIGDPLTWDPVLGAGEIVMTDDVTGFLVQAGDQSTGSMAIYSNNDTSILYGSSSADFKLVSYNVGTGAKAYTAQNMAQSYVFDDRGVISLQASLNFGNFDTASLTMNIRPFVQERRTKATASSINREKAQYRVFFSDGFALYLTISNGQLVGVMPMLLKHPVTCICDGERPDGSEASYFGSNDGFVYRLDAGTSFDGQPIPGNLELVFNAAGGPRILKRYRKASLEVTGTSFAEFQFSYDLGYASTEYEQPMGQTYTNNLTPTYWDKSAWETFVWDGRTLAPTDVEVEGTGENIAIRISSESAICEAFTINSAIVHYSPRRGIR
jgi:hypothetical protein